jgi:predicted transcriptional regulator
MSALSLRLPQSLHRKLGELAEREGISINQLINSAVAEKMSALMTEEYLQARAARGARRKFSAALAKVADREPDASDRLVTRETKKRKRPASV